jgi:hypothetical protein
MSTDERAARERRRAHFAAQGKNEGESHKKAKEPSNDALALAVGQTEITTGTVASESSPLPPTSAASKGRKPWESLVIGSLGENLSHIEQKDRQIEQQRYIVRYHEEHSPRQVEHNRRILDHLVQEREALADNEENNMPEYVDYGKEELS